MQVAGVTIDITHGSDVEQGIKGLIINYPLFDFKDRLVAICLTVQVYQGLIILPFIKSTR